MYTYIYTYIEYFIHIQINFVKHIRFLNKKHMFDKVDLYINKILQFYYDFFPKVLLFLLVYPKICFIIYFFWIN